MLRPATAARGFTGRKWRHLIKTMAQKAPSPEDGTRERDVDKLSGGKSAAPAGNKGPGRARVRERPAPRRAAARAPRQARKQLQS